MWKVAQRKASEKPLLLVIVFTSKILASSHVCLTANVLARRSVARLGALGPASRAGLQGMTSYLSAIESRRSYR
jgi:hypothetical protein